MLELAAGTCDGLLPVLLLMRWPGLLFVLLAWAEDGRTNSSADKNSPPSMCGCCWCWVLLLLLLLGCKAAGSAMAAGCSARRPLAAPLLLLLLLWPGPPCKLPGTPT
jgi:hypothetical protein